MDIQITNHPAAKPCFAVSEIVAFAVVGIDNSGSPETYQWTQDGDNLGGATSATYNHTVTSGDYGTKIQCNVSGRLSNSVGLLPLEPEIATVISRRTAPYSYLAGGTATLVFIANGTNMTYEVFDPTPTSIAGPTACANGEVIVWTSGADPTEGNYQIIVTGDGGIASVTSEIRAFAIDEELLLWSRSVKVGTGTDQVQQAGYNDIGGLIQFGQIERNPWLIQRFTGDDAGNITMRLDNFAELPGAPATQEVSIDGLFHTTLTWVGTASVDGIYTTVDHHFAKHMLGLPDFGFATNESAVLDFRNKVVDAATIDVIGYGGADGDYAYGYNGDFGTATITTSTGVVESILVDDPDATTTTTIRVKYDDAVNVFNQVSMELVSVNSGQTTYLRRVPEEVGQTVGINKYVGECDTNSSFIDDIGRDFKTAYDLSANAATATATSSATLITDANTALLVTVTDNGGGYSTPPVVTFSTGTGGTATGTAVLTGDEVTSVNIDTPGSYLDAELPITLTIAAPAGVVAAIDITIRIFN